MASFDLKLLGEDSESLARSIEIKIKGKKAAGPIHGITKKDAEIYSKFAKKPYPDSTVNIAGENLNYDTFDNLTSANALHGLMKRLSDRTYMPKDTINIVYPRIPKTYTVNGVTYTHTKISDLQASNLAGVALDAGTDILIPAMPGSIINRKLVKKVIGRTINEIQTFNDWRPMMAYIPRVDDIELATYMVEQYLKMDKECRIFGIDFSGASYPSPLLRAVIRKIRNTLGIKGRRESNEVYYLHGFNVAKSRKSTKEISSVTDILTHTYGIDTSSNVIWGGGDLEPEKCRYLFAEDYGAYRFEGVKDRKPTCDCPVCKQYTLDEIYSRNRVIPALKTHKMHTFYHETKKLSKKIEENDPKRGYLPYLETKKHASGEVKKIMNDVKEILVS